MSDSEQAQGSGGGMGYVPALDGVRAIAALGVVLLHYLFEFSETQPRLSFRGGYFGVDIFFMLSGFLITTLLVEEHQRQGRIVLRAFWVRRALRLMPALVLVLAALIVLGRLADDGLIAGQGLRAEPGDVNGLTALPFWPGLAVVLLPISNWVWGIGGAIFSPLAVSWSLAIEDQFYLVWPFVLTLLLARRKLTLRICAVLIAGLTVGGYLWQHALIAMEVPFPRLRTDFFAAEILAGCTVGLALAAGMMPSHPRVRPVLGACAWASLAGILALFVLNPSHPELVLALLALMTLLLITHLVTDQSSRLSALMSWPPLVGIGQVSYGLYLWHWVWLQYPVWMGWETPARLPFAIVLTVISVLVSYYVVERPALRLKRRFQPASADPPTRSAAPASPATGRRPARTTRRDLLPVLGMGSVAVAAVATYGLSQRLYPQPTGVLAAPPEPTATPVSTTVPTPRPTRPTKPTRAPRRQKQKRD